MTYKEMPAEAQTAISYIETLFGEHGNPTPEIAQRLNSRIAPHIPAVESYIETDKNWTYQQYSRDFKPDMGCCPSTQTLAEWRGKTRAAFRSFMEKLA